MNEKMEKYAKVILESCLKVEQDTPLFISYNSEVSYFVRILANCAYKLGVKDICFDSVDVNLKHDLLLNLDYDDLKNYSFWNKEKWNEYARKGASFVMLASETPGLMKDVDQEKLSKLTAYSLSTRKEFDKLRDKLITPWTIAAVPTLSWAKQVFPESSDPVNDLWNKIFEICAINEENPEQIWDKKIERLKKQADKLTKLNFKRLTYTNSLGTNFSIELLKDSIWASGREELVNGKSILVNYPTEEVFTSPNCESAEGIVYASKPLSYQDNIIDNFWIKFEKGKVVDCHAEVGEETLRQLIKSCPNADRLGEVALVPYDSPISNSGVLFYETLFDENASCHLALGDSFQECLKNGINMDEKELTENKLNKSDNHVDFMIGTKDLSIIGETFDGKNIEIFRDGNFCI